MSNRKVIFALIILAAGVVMFATGCRSGSGAANANTASEPTVVDVTTAQAVVQPIPQYVEATGSLASDAQSDVAPAVSGKIIEVNFDVGSYVTQGSVLIRLDPRDAQIRLEQSRAQLEQQKKAAEQAHANVDQAIANLRQTQARLGVVDGQNFQIRDFSQVKQVTAQLELAEKELRRAEKLLETGDIPRNVYDQRKAQRDSLLGQLDEARSNAAVAIRAINTAQAQVDTARAAAATAQAGVQTAETQVAQAAKGVADTAVLSPISGSVSERNADVGEYISPSVPNSKIATIMRTSTLRVKIDIPEQTIGKVEVGQGVSVQTSAYPDRSFAGTIARISPGLSTQSRTLTVEAEIQNVDGLLKPGQFATVRITQSQPENAVMVPTSAVLAVADTNVVFIVKDGAVREQIVQLGLIENNMIQVRTGVVEGDVVATSNLEQLSDGTFVRAV